ELDRSIAEARSPALHVDLKRLLRIAPDRALQPREILCRGGQAGNAEGHAIAEEDLGERTRDDRRDAPALERLPRMLTRGATSEVEAADEDRGPLVRLLVERMLGILLARVLERVLAEPLERHRLEKPRGNDAVGVDVVAGQRDRPSPDLLARRARAHLRALLMTSRALVDPAR